MTAVDAAELWFQGVHVTTSDTDLAWLYNIITNLAQQPIQDAITREVAAQVRTTSILMSPTPDLCLILLRMDQIKRCFAGKMSSASHQCTLLWYHA